MKPNFPYHCLRSYSARMEREERIAKVGTVDWSYLLNFADDYMQRAYDFYSQFPGGGWVTDEERPFYDAMRIAENKLYDVAITLHIPSDILVKAQRALNHHYARGNGSVIDAEKLIRSMV